MKRLLVIALVLIIFACLCVGMFACSDNDTPQKPDVQDNQQAAAPVYANASTSAELYAAAVHDVPTIGDYNVPEEFDLNTIRLSFWSPETGWTEDIDNAPFDENKPTVIHAHGQGGDAHMFTPQAMYDSGYNIISFLWGCLSDDELAPIEQKIWERIGKYKDYTRVKNSIVYTDDFDCTITELYAARYCDFFALYPDYDMPIRLTGHSYGGQLNFAMASYLTTIYLQGRLPARLLPERYTLLDPYFDNMKISFDCRWLNKTFTYSSVEAAIYCMNNILIPNNIAIEMLRTSPLVELINGIADSEAPDYFTGLKFLFRLTELNNINELRDQFDDMAVGMGFWHTIANDFYFSPQASNLYYENDQVIFGRETSSSFMLATRAMHFDLWVDDNDYTQYQNVKVARTVEDEEEDNVTVIAGLVMLDANGDGAPNDKACYRLSGVTVVLTNVDSGEQKTVSTVNGFYSFDVEREHTYTVALHAGNYQSPAETTIRTQQQFCHIADFALAKQQ